MNQFDKPSEVFRAKVDPVGRVLIPAATRQRFGIGQGDELLVEVDERGIHLSTLEQAIKEVQAFFADAHPEDGRMLSEELIQERREDAAREDRD